MPPSSTSPPLARYKEKRNFAITSEPDDTPSPEQAAKPGSLAFVIQKHWATRLHYDFRLEWRGVLLSWAVPKGPSVDPMQKRMAVHVEDHPLPYAGFEGTIPPKQYGAGEVIVWDRGTWEPVGDAQQGLDAGKLVFALHGEKLAGLWELVRIAKPGDRQDPWILFKKRDAWARPTAEYDVVVALPDSVLAHPLGLREEREPVADPQGATGAATAPGARAVTSRSSPKEKVATGATLPTPAEPHAGNTHADADRAAYAAAPTAELPPTLRPQLATLASRPPTTGEWIVEHKLDGYRILARIARPGEVQLFTRNGHDWTAKMTTLAAAVAALPIDSGWLDGEIVVLDEHGAPRFNALQNAMDQHRNEQIVYVVFDAPLLNGKDLRKLPVRARRAALRPLIVQSASTRSAAAEQPPRVRWSEDFDAPPAQLLEAACRLQLEGVMLKRADAPYLSARSETWLKLKCTLRQEFVVCGYTDRQGAPNEVGSLLLGVYEAGRLRHCGSVGTGWDTAAGRAMHAQLRAITVDTPTLDAAAVAPGRWSRRTPGGEHWVTPTLVAEVAFSEWTPDHHVRHPVFKGLRSDKPATTVRREDAVVPDGDGDGDGDGAASAATGAAPAKSAKTGKPATHARAARRAAPADPDGSGESAKAAKSAKSTPPPKTATPLKITHPDRVVDPSTGLTKLDLIRYYEGIAERLLPHLKNRPVSLVRAPDGINGTLFFQKHPESKMPGLTALDPALWPGHAALLTLDNPDALLAAAQMNVVEFHTWNSTIKRIDQPDRMVYDLDPGEGVGWPQIQESALLMRTMLTELGLESWLKTSGGKGLHVVVPLTPKLEYATVKAFSQAVVQHMAEAIPQRFVAKSGGANRVGKIFIDYLRNGHGQTTAAAFSARSRPGLGVSMPVAWEQLNDLKGGAQWTIATAREYLSFERADPWVAYWTTRQTLTVATKRLGFVAPKALSTRG